MAAIAFPEYPIKPGDAVPMILEGTLTALDAVAADGGAANWSLVIAGTADNQITPGIDTYAHAAVCPLGFINEHSDTLAVAGDQVTLYQSGIVWAIAGGAIAKGRPVMSEATATQVSGRVTVGSTGFWCVGIAMAAAAALNDAIPIRVAFFQYD